MKKNLSVICRVIYEVLLTCSFLFKICKSMWSSLIQNENQINICMFALEKYFVYTQNKTKTLQYCLTKVYIRGSVSIYKYKSLSTVFTKSNHKYYRYTTPIYRSVFYLRFKNPITGIASFLELMKAQKLFQTTKSCNWWGLENLPSCWLPSPM